MINDKCKDCSLFLEVQELKKIVLEQAKKIEYLEKELEKYKKPPKNSGNSSIPPSKNLWSKKYPDRPPTTLKVGAQPGHIGKNKKYSDEVNQIISINSNVCKYCGEKSFIEKSSNIQKRQLFDIAEIKPYITEYQRKDLVCTNCNRKNKGKFPIKGNVELGKNVEKLIVYFNVQHHISYERLTQIFNEIFGLKISYGTVDKKIKKISEYLKIHNENI